MTQCVANTNLLASNRFRAKLQHPRFAYLSYNIIRASLPSVSVQSVPSSFKQTSLKVPGERITFEAITLGFLIDEGGNSFNEAYEWMKDNAFAAANGEEHLYVDFTLDLLDSNNIPVITVLFRNCVATSLTGIDLDAQSRTIEYPTASLTLEYSHFEVRPASK